MTPAARVAAAIVVLDDVLAGRPAEHALIQWARSARYAGSKDRAAVRDHVFQALRRRRSYAALGGGQTGRAIMIGALRSEDQALDDIFTGERYAPAPLSEEERSVRSLPQSDAERLDLPEWIWERFQSALGEVAAQAAAHLQTRAPVMLRVNERIKNTDEAIEILKKDGVLSVVSDIAPSALRVLEGARRIATSEAYSTGIVELQDGSSQAAMHQVLMPENARVLDYCAGGGGKTLALAAHNDAKWFAHDADENRTKDLPPRAARAGVDVALLSPGNAKLAAPFDVVLCDVPCSGSGTWRRSPDAKWRLTQEKLTELMERQRGILYEAAALLGTGGRLVYSTCSILKEENEDQIADFIAAHQGWTVTSMRRWPISTSGDGFFLAQLMGSN